MTVPIREWTFLHRNLTFRRVLPLVKTNDEICRQFYRFGMKRSFSLERFTQFRGQYAWIRTNGLVRL